MDLVFDTRPDVIGLGRVIVNGHYYGLPVDAVEFFFQLTMMVSSPSDTPLTDATSR
jgi:hypothetical protein